jgi:hypothetical protein
MRRGLQRLFVGAVVVVAFEVPLAAPALSAPNVSEATVLSRIPRSFLARMKHRAPVAPNGAVGRNAESWIAIEGQAFTAELTSYALPSRDAATMGEAFKVADFGFAHEQPGGGFQGGGASSAAMFVQDVGHTLLLLDASDWFNQDPSTQSLLAKQATLRRQESTALAYLMNSRTYLERDTDAANRRARYADAYYFAGMAERDPDAINVGRAFLRSFLADQGSDGTFYELGGFDSSYQCASIYLAEILFLNMPKGELRNQVWTSIVRGIGRERQALTPSGAIGTLHNTRTGVDSQMAARTGAVYNLDAGHAALAFQYYAAITGEPQAIQDARSVSLYYWPGSVP